MTQKKSVPLVAVTPDKHRMLRFISAHYGRSLRELIDEAIDQYLERELEKAPVLKQLNSV